MAGNDFKPKKFEDHEIVDAEGKKVGEIRVKPSGILWAPKGSHEFYGVRLDDFAKFMEAHGTKQKK